MITPAFGLTATERVLPKLALDFTTASTDARVTTTRANNTATRFNSSGAIEIVNANLPRYDFDPVTLVCRGQIIEEARTNLFLNSLINGSNLTTQSVTLSAIPYTLTFYGTGSIVISGGHSATVLGAGAFPTRGVYVFTPTAGSSTFTVSGTVSYAQLEAGGFATSFIPTAGTSVLRNADAVSMTGTNFSSWYNASEGTFVLEYFDTGNNGTATGLVANAGALTNRIGVFIDGSSGAPVQPNFVVVNSGSIQANILGSAPPANTVAKLAAAYKENSFAFALNGSLINTDPLGTIPTVDQLQIGSQLSGSFANRHIAKINYFPQRLTDAEVQAFSK